MNKQNELEHMSYQSLMYIKQNNPSWKLMNTRNAPFIISFLYEQFVYNSNRQIGEGKLVFELENHLEETGYEADSSRAALEYLREWASDEYSWLRRFHARESDEVQYDLTSTAQKAIEWLIELKGKNFIGTESRLIMVFDLLNQIARKTETDPELRIAELERQKLEIEAEIENVKKGDIKILQSTQIKERFMQATMMSKEILSDFRAVEQNFRELNRNTRIKIAQWDKSKGELIGDYFNDQNDIYKSDQGQSFNAFFEFLMSRSAQDDLDNILDKLNQLEELKEELAYSGLEEIVEDWLEGSKHVWKTVEIMSEQLRRYIDENYLEEERRINQVIKNIERNAVSVIDDLPSDFTIEIEETKPSINLLFDRSLFKVPEKIIILDEVLNIGQTEDSDEALYAQAYIDREKLKANVEMLLRERREVTLQEVTINYPLEYGLAEYLSYLTLDKLGLNLKINEMINDQIKWIDSLQNQVVANAKRVIFYTIDEEK